MKNHVKPNHKIKSSLQNQFSELKVIIIDEISMVSNDLLFYIHLRLTEIFGTKNGELFGDLSVIAVGDFFSTSTSKLFSF